MENQEEPVKLTKIEEAAKLVERMETLKKENEDLINKIEAMKVNDLLSGETSAGKPQETKTAEEIKKEKLSEYFRGTEIENAIVKNG